MKKSFLRQALAALTLAVAFAWTATLAQAAPFVYVTNGVSGNVSQYATDAGGGLSPLSPATVDAGEGPSSVALTPNGKSAYVPNADGTVSEYNIDPSSGVLSPKTPASVAAGAAP